MSFYKKIWSSLTFAYILAFFKYGRLGNDTYLEVRGTQGKGEGLFTTKKRARGDLVFIAKGRAISAHFDGNDVYKFPDWYSIEKDLWIDIVYPFIKINHSCNPNTGIDSARCFVALRDIESGEELTFDYSTTEEEPDWIMSEECACGTVNCAKRIGPVWTMSEERYNYSFPFIPKHFQKIYKTKHAVPK